MYYQLLDELFLPMKLLRRCIPSARSSPMQAFVTSAVATSAAAVFLTPAFAAGPVSCESLREQIASRTAPSRAALLTILPTSAVSAGDSAAVVGSCEGGTKRILLPKAAGGASSTVATRKTPVDQSRPPPGFTDAGPHAPGLHQSTGPVTCAQLVGWPVTVPTPNCDGTVGPDEVLSSISKISGKVPGLGQVLDYLNSQGWGAKRHQDFARCTYVCTTIPDGVAFNDSNLQVRFSLSGVKPLGDMGKRDEGRWGPGAEGYWRIDPGYYVAATRLGGIMINGKLVGADQVVCKTARNWSTSHSRLFQLVANYQIGTSTKVIPPEPVPPDRACEPLK